tara:strand:+ start:1971 stop:2744 length:774 start_codon:yes stop_codon:yes gene_type:complete
MPRFFLEGVYIGDYKGILFDKDGTLSNSEYRLKEIAKVRIEESINELKKEFKEEEIRKFIELITIAYGLTSNSINPQGGLAIASRHDNLISTATIFCLIGMTWSKSILVATEIFSRADEININNTENNNKETLLPGVKNLLNNLNNTGIKCALISNDTKKGIQNFLELNGLQREFNSYWSSEDYPMKPNPNAVKKLCSKLKLETSECILIGDSDLDMQMAQEAGIGLSLAYLSGWGIKPKLYHQSKIILNWNDICCL